jgi:hypothetical protein
MEFDSAGHNEFFDGDEGACHEAAVELFFSFFRGCDVLAALLRCALVFENLANCVMSMLVAKLVNLWVLLPELDQFFLAFTWMPLSAIIVAGITLFATWDYEFILLEFPRLALIARRLLQSPALHPMKELWLVRRRVFVDAANALVATLTGTFWLASPPVNLPRIFFKLAIDQSFFLLWLRLRILCCVLALARARLCLWRHLCCTSRSTARNRRKACNEAPDEYPMKGIHSEMSDGNGEQLMIIKNDYYSMLFFER